MLQNSKLDAHSHRTSTICIVISWSSSSAKTAHLAKFRKLHSNCACGSWKYFVQETAPEPSSNPLRPLRPLSPLSPGLLCSMAQVANNSFQWQRYCLQESSSIMSIPQWQTKSGLGELMMRVKGTNYAGGPQSVDPDVFCDVSYDVLWFWCILSPEIPAPSEVVCCSLATQWRRPLRICQVALDQWSYARVLGDGSCCYNWGEFELCKMNDHPLIADLPFEKWWCPIENLLNYQRVLYIHEKNSLRSTPMTVWLNVSPRILTFQLSTFSHATNEALRQHRKQPGSSGKKTYIWYNIYWIITNIECVISYNIQYIYIYIHILIIYAYIYYDFPCNSGPDPGPWIFKGPLVAS